MAWKACFMKQKSTYSTVQGWAINRKHPAGREHPGAATLEPGEGRRPPSKRPRQPRPRGGGLLRSLRREELPAQAAGSRLPYRATSSHFKSTSVCKASNLYKSASICRCRCRLSVWKKFPIILFFLRINHFWGPVPPLCVRKFPVIPIFLRKIYPFKGASLCEGSPVFLRETQRDPPHCLKDVSCNPSLSKREAHLRAVFLCGWISL
jgi:hypothetical protein